MYKRVLINGLILLGLLFIFLAYSPNPNSQSMNNRSTLSLQSPSFFVGVAQAANSEISTNLDNEAGISAYFKSPDVITLSQVRGQFRTIELETADYILGSVAVPGYVEHFDTHVYVHKNGWILVYYLRSDPTSKIIDIRNQTISTTKLKTVAAIIAGAAGAPFNDVAYYDFRYPNATNILFVAEDIANGNDFTILLPSSYGYFERGFSFVCPDYGPSFTIDGVNMLNQAHWHSGGIYYGVVPASNLQPDITHTVVINDSYDDRYGVLTVTYRVP